MSVKIRLARFGAKKKPYYRIVVSDSDSPRDGRFIEQIGVYEPLKEGENVKLDAEKVKHWLSKGAIPTVTVASFLKKLNLEKPAAQG